MNLKLSHVQALAIASIGMGGMAVFSPSSALFTAGLGLAGYAGYQFLSNLPKKNSALVKEVLHALNYGGARYGKYPAQINKSKSDTHLVYELKPGMCPGDFEELQPRLNSHLKAETEIYSNNGQLHIKVMAENLPKSKMYNQELKPPDGMVLPIPIGYSRAGFLWADIVGLPHLAVAGETRGGKSNFLHQATACLIHNEKVKLHVIDLKKVEFGYLRDHAEVAMTLPDSLRMLEFLTFEMMHRMDLLVRKRKNNVAGMGLPYHVLILDEISQLSPSLATDSQVKEMCKMAHQMLTSLICLSAALGIHIIASTQRPDKDVLPGQLKANIPAALCFQVKNRDNSRIVLDSTKGAFLPPIRGRAIWQFDVEREIQVQHLPVEMARRLLPKKPVTKPEYPSLTADGKV